MENKQRVFCMECHADLTDVENLEKCECGSKNFIYGETLVLKDGELQCECGSNKLYSQVHIDYTDRAVTTYTCLGCGAAISTEVHREMPWY